MTKTPSPNDKLYTQKEMNYWCNLAKQKGIKQNKLEQCRKIGKIMTCDDCIIKEKIKSQTEDEWINKILPEQLDISIKAEQDRCYQEELSFLNYILRIKRVQTNIDFYILERAKKLKELISKIKQESIK